MRSRDAVRKFVPMWRVALRGVLLVIASSWACAGPAVAGTSEADLKAYRHNLALKLQKSPSPRDWALGSQLLDTRTANDATLRQRALILQKAARSAPQDRLVQTL